MNAPVVVFVVVDCRDKISSINATSDFAQSKVDRFNADPFIEPGTPDPFAPYRVERWIVSEPTGHQHEITDLLAQFFRDLGIEDACAGKDARFEFRGGRLWESRDESFEEVEEGSVEYRSAFAYARAYEAEKGVE